ncbi:hypothetical protein ZIOFF_004305 [Zingiber officinale]|uniref:heme oxygenase (biliverdin-producing) n=1 Tax=Zingiber officinale TaxID=94328 RepID=A0A8J5I0C6_ZINOF|nr:hypothetical protein ZIOFF_004305 [Zingiber officinale]
MSKSHRTFPSVCGTRHDDRFYVPIEEEHSAVLGCSCATRLVSFNWLKVSVGFVHCVTLSSSSSSWQILAVLLPFSIMKLHTKDQAKEGEKESKSPPVAKWEPSIEGYLYFLVDSKIVYDTLEMIIQKAAYPWYAEFRSTGLERSEN